MKSVVQLTLSPYTAERFAVQGDDIQVSPQIALAISMAVHELCTNATKYGALSGAGRVRIVWAVEGNRLSLHWTEHDGPPVTAPSRKGFGSRMLRQAFASVPDGRVEIDFDPAGLQCRMGCSLG